MILIQLKISTIVKISLVITEELAKMELGPTNVSVQLGLQELIVKKVCYNSFYFFEKNCS